MAAVRSAAYSSQVTMRRPDLSSASPEIVRYVEYLERKCGLNEPSILREPSHEAEEVAELSYIEPVTSQCILTVSQSGIAKRTYRHLYTRQHRGGMGVFDLDVNPPDAPGLLASADESQTLLLFTNLARVFRFPMHQIDLLPVRAPGNMAFERLGFVVDEHLVAALPEQAHGYVTLVSQLGKVRSFRHHVFGEHMRPGNSLFNLAEFGPLAAACWTPGDGDLFIVSRKGVGIRFSEKSLSPQGTLGMRITEGDQVVGLTPVDDESAVFLLGSDGKGSLRLMSGFAANKSPGGSGKIAFRNNAVIGASAVSPSAEIFAITQSSKIVRFLAEEVASSEAPVQGVNCVALRLDWVQAFVAIENGEV
jgi:DNA gyrase subunit A